MAFDPNTYAIQIALTIDAAEAFNTVNELESRFGGIEQSISNAMAGTMATIVEVTSDINEQLLGMNNVINDINTQYVTQSDNIGETLEQQIESIDNIQNIHDLEEEIRDLQQEIFDIGEEYEELSERVLDLVTDIELNNAQSLATHTQINDQLGLMNQCVDEFGEHIDHNQIGIENNQRGFQEVFRLITQSSHAMYGIANTLAGMTKGTEDFVTANNRAYGSQHELLEAVTDTASEFGTLQEATQEAYRELIGIKVPIELLEEYAGMVAQTSRISGAGISTLANYTRTLKGSGLEANDTAYALSTLTAAQEAFGLTTAEVNSILSEHIDKLGLMTSFYGEEIPRDMAIARAALMGIAKDVGMGTSGINKLNEMLHATGKEAIILRGLLGSSFDGSVSGRLDAINERFGKLGKRLYDAQIMSQATGKSIDGVILALSAEAEAYGGNIDIVRMYSEQLKTTGGDLSQLHMTLADYENQLGVNLDKQKQFDDSINTLWFSVQSLETSMWALVAPFIQFIARGMIPLIQIATFVIDVFVSLIDIFTGTWSALESILPPLVWVRQGLEILAALTLSLGGIIVGLTGFVIALGMGFGLFGTSLRIIGGLIGHFITTIHAGLAALGSAFISFMTTLGAGINALGTAIAPVAIPILALSASLMMVGAGAYFFAEGVATIAQEGWASVGAIVGLTIAVAGLGLVLVGLGILAMGVGPGMLAVGASLLMVGAAAYLVGSAVALAGDSLTNLLNSITDDIGIRLMSLAAGLTVLSLASMIITPGLLSLSIGLIAIAGPAYLAGIGLQSLAGALTTLSTMEFPNLGGKLLVFAAEIAFGALVLGAALIPLALSGVGLWAFAQGMDALKDMTFPNLGGKLLIFAAEVAFGATILGIAIAPLALAGIGLWAFAIGLKRLSGFTVPDLGFKLIGLAGQLAIGAYVLGIAIAPLALAGAGLWAFAIGLKRLSGFKVPDLGLKLINLAADLSVGAYVLGVAVAPLVLAGAGLWAFATGLKQLSGFKVPNIGTDLVELARSLAIASAVLGPSVVLLTLSGVGLWAFAQGLNEFKELEVGDIGKNILAMANDVNTAAVTLGSASIILITSAATLTIAGYAFIAAGASITIGSATLQYASASVAVAGVSLAAASAYMLVGAISMSYASSYLNNSLTSLEDSAVILENFSVAAEKFSSISFNALHSSVVDLGNTAGNMIYYLDSLSEASAELNNANVDAKGLADSIITAATLLEEASLSLSGPATTLTNQIDGIVQQVERLVAAEVQIREIGNEIAAVTQQPRDNTQQPNEMRNVEKVTQAINAVVNSGDDNAEIVALLQRIAVLLEKQAEKDKPEHKPFFQNEDGEEPTGIKFREVGITI